MPSTREVRRRIRSIKNTAQITKAMQMVASSKMRRAQDRVQQARPYAEQIRALVSRLANASSEDVGEGVALLKERPVRNIGMLIITPDRCLATSTAARCLQRWNCGSNWRNRDSSRVWSSWPWGAKDAIL